MSHDNHESGRKQKKRRKEKSVGVFQDSGLTDDDRRRLRKQQRDLHTRIAQEDGKEEDEATMDFLERGRSDNNKLFKKVCFTREGVLDAENNLLITEKVLQQTDQLIQVPRFDATKLANKLRSKLTTNRNGTTRQFDWLTLGQEASVCFNAIPCGVTFLAGTMDVEISVAKKARKPRAKRINVDAMEEERPEQVDAGKNTGDADQLSAAEQEMKVIRHTLRKLCKKDDGDMTEVDGVKFLFNPKSFTQTVENIFNFSFMIKKAEAEIGVRSKQEAEPEEGKLPGLFVRAVPDAERGHCEQLPDPPVDTQAVVAFTMRDWRRICQAHHLKEGILKHRKGSKHAKKASPASQSQN